MSSTKFNPQTAVVLLFIVLTGAVRVLLNLNLDSGRISELALYSPIGAMALFGGACFNCGWKALLFPLGTLFLSDFILHQTVFKLYGNGFLYSGWGWVYGTFALMVLVGKWMMTKVTAGNFIAAVLVAVLIHWVVTDTGVWAGSKIYAQNGIGFLQCLTAAIPFEGRFLLSTAIYGAVLFGGFGLLKTRYPVLQRQR